MLKILEVSIRNRESSFRVHNLFVLSKLNKKRDKNMPREEHLVRQVEWKKKLEQYGKVELEKQLSIRGAKIFADVYGQIEEKEFIIEVGDIADGRKNALLQLYAESRPNVVFIHEAYGENKIREVLEQINAYLHSPERQLEMRKKIEELEKKKKALPKDTMILGIGETVVILIFLLLFSAEVIPYLAFLFLFVFGLVVFLFFVGRIGIERQIEKIKQMQPKTSTETPKDAGKDWFLKLVEQTSEENIKSYEKAMSEEGNEKEAEHDVTYGEDTWEQEDDEWTEELDSVDEMEW